MKQQEVFMEKETGKKNVAIPVSGLMYDVSHTEGDSVALGCFPR